MRTALPMALQPVRGQDVLPSPAPDPGPGRPALPGPRRGGALVLTASPAHVARRADHRSDRCGQAPSLYSRSMPLTERTIATVGSGGVAEAMIAGLLRGGG